ncbi:group II intron reverse transcriptase/maturase [Polyangium mundeleinium]|uniref:Group II intron reverse transcriptase/maturase n=1 Tax=Polyangium mundeleinium TaxID=2995306 RepID=A0ABT5ES96_9BACT|nr:group II intron reverse transcriptase/maturase [Polyangium mundeleinium]MDC0740869.1 group II intron reverse transcriptase/maturase [Polyangium mundeleinium]MDC0740912.1 group II intron reverse transcriptase/maturase [Polyangium mundeleinium]MDC0744688.1 group II intron reverse transcriptase/maturase [Polyangium mundeleinium]
MPDALMSENMSPGLLKVAERARREPEGRFHALAHLIDGPALARAYRRMRKDAAVGVDGVTKEQYGLDLERNLQGLHERLRSKRYRHQPIRRVHIPKDKGKTRPIGISAFEDKLVQDAVREVLEAIYEQDFLDCSYGFRPGRSAHDAIRALDRLVYKGKVGWILEADIVSFFDSVDRTKLLEMLQTRVADGSLLRLIGKCLHVGVLDGAEYSEPEIGTAQGSVLSPLLGNIYLHYVLDLWFDREVKPRTRGEAHLIRYADDFVMVFERQDDAERVMEVLHKRMGRFGLTLHPDKTRLLPFQRPPAAQTGGKGLATFDFLGFTLYWRRTLRGQWQMACKTRSARLRRAVQSVADWCRRYRHLPVKVQHAALKRRIQGHFNYFGVNGNVRSLLLLVEEAKRAWYKWLCRRSNRVRLNWEGFGEMLKSLPLPRPRVIVRIWGT